MFVQAVTLKKDILESFAFTSPKMAIKKSSGAQVAKLKICENFISSSKAELCPSIDIIEVPVSESWKNSHLLSLVSESVRRKVKEVKM